MLLWFSYSFLLDFNWYYRDRGRLETIIVKKNNFMSTPSPQPSLPPSCANLQPQNITISTQQTLNPLNISSTILQGTRTNSHHYETSGSQYITTLAPKEIRHIDYR